MEKVLHESQKPWNVHQKGKDQLPAHEQPLHAIGEKNLQQASLKKQLGGEGTQDHTK